MHWYLTVLKKYAVFTGRARRKEYWMFVLVNILISVVLFGGDVLVRGGFDEAMAATIGFSGVYGLAVLLPSIGVQVRRLHDLDRTGWWLLMVLLPQGIGWMVSLLRIFGLSEAYGLSDPQHPLLVVSGILIMGGGLILFVFFCMKGTHGSNRYGADPLGGGIDDDADVWPDIA